MPIQGSIFPSREPSQPCRLARLRFKSRVEELVFSKEYPRKIFPEGTWALAKPAKIKSTTPMQAALSMRRLSLSASMNPYATLKFWMWVKEIRLQANWLMKKCRQGGGSETPDNSGGGPVIVLVGTRI